MSSGRDLWRDRCLPMFVVSIHTSVADMWQKVAGIFTFGGKHQIWYMRVLMYAESIKIGRQAVKSTEPFHFGVCFWHILLLIKSYFLCLPCMSVQFHMYFSIRMYIVMSLYPQRYICKCIYTHMYSRHAIGRSWVRVPPGVGYFPSNVGCFKKTFSSRKWVLFTVHHYG